MGGCLPSKENKYCEQKRIPALPINLIEPNPYIQSSRKDPTIILETSESQLTALAQNGVDTAKASINNMRTIATHRESPTKNQAPEQRIAQVLQRDQRIKRVYEMVSHRLNSKKV